ncbi:MAG: TonB-dependent siderophore receptor [Thiobacillus sp.]|nr:TonB-dependent siderophore receptor [Thiobacillus sp.]
MNTRLPALRPHAKLLPMALAACGFADLALARGDQPVTLQKLEVVDFRGEQMDSLKYARDLQDTPRLITVLPDDLLQEQGATTLKDALKNIPGISLQAGEGNPPAGDQFKIRGFNARDDINVNGTRDLGNYFRDPFYVDQLEVVKGPNSAFSGRGSAGGTVNFVTKQPFGQDFNRAELSVGTDSFYRGTLDMNKTLGDNSAVRVNLMAHSADIPGRDIAEEERYGLYAAYTWGLKGPTRITLDYLHTRQDDLPDAGLPADRNNVLGTLSGIETGMPPGLDYENFYGHTNDRKQVDVDQFGAALQHSFGNGVTLKNQLRLSRVHNDGWVSSPRIFVGAIGANPTDGTVTSCTVADPCARGETKPRDQTDTGINNQTDVLFNFKTGGVEHDMVAGIALARYEYENDRRRDTRGPLTSLYRPSARALGPNQSIGGTLFGIPAPDGTTYSLETREVGLYLLDTMKLDAQWDLHAGLRWDKVEATAKRRGFNGVTNPSPANNTTHKREDDEISYNLGLVYKLTPQASLYGAFGNAYVFSANFDRNSIQLAGGAAAEPVVGAGFNTPPEQIRAYEFGGKWQVAHRLDLGAAIFRTDVTNGRLPAQAPGVTSLVDNRYHIDGFELLAAGDITPKWKLYSGYAYLTSKIKAAPAAGSHENYVKSQKLGNTPEHSFNVFTTYDLTPAVTVGGGMQYVDSITSGVDNAAGDTTYKVRVPGYTTWDLYAAYKFSKQTQLRLNGYNVTDKRYISQLAEGGGQGIPGRGRQYVLTLRHDF